MEKYDEALFATVYTAMFPKKEGDTPMPHQVTELDLVKVEPGVTVISTDSIDSPVFFRTKSIATQPGEECEIFGLEESDLSVRKRPLEQQFYILDHVPHSLSGIPHGFDCWCSDDLREPLPAGERCRKLAVDGENRNKNHRQKLTLLQETLCGIVVHVSVNNIQRI